MEKLRNFWKRLHQGYVRFVEKQGFPIIVGVCVLVIAATALWTRKDAAPLVSPTPPVSDQAAEAAQLMQEKLNATLAPTATPTPAPEIFDAPLPQIRVLQGFDAVRLQKLGSGSLWVLHDAADLAGDTGDPVKAMADGVVSAVDEDGVAAVSVSIDHGRGVVATYAGMSAKTALIVGDPVERGQTIGFVGAGVIGEDASKPHLHLRVTRNGNAIDPTLLW